MLFQQENLVGHLSVDANVALVQRLAGDADPQRRATLLEDCDISRRSAARPAQLSGGELARAGLAVALANEPPLLLADEPTGELDDATAARVLQLLRERAARGAAVLVVTHSAEIAGQADREIRLRDGQVQA
jgi:putative ABC transport system ATP-binding protein